MFLAQLLQVTLHTCHRLHVYAKCSILTLHIRKMPKMFLYSDSTDELKNLSTVHTHVSQNLCVIKRVTVHCKKVCCFYVAMLFCFQNKIPWIVQFSKGNTMEMPCYINMVQYHSTINQKYKGSNKTCSC